MGAAGDLNSTGGGRQVSFHPVALMKALRHPGGNRAVPVVLLDDGLAPASVVAAVKAGIAGKVSLPGNIHEVRQVLRDMETGAMKNGGSEKDGPETGAFDSVPTKHPDGGDA